MDKKYSLKKAIIDPTKTEEIYIMEMYYNSFCYDDFNYRFGTPSHKKCIDGRFTGSNKCCAFCNYAGHPGYLTKDHIERHECIEKKCLYYIEKINKPSIKKTDVNKELFHTIEAIILNETSDYDGFKLMGLRWEGASVVINYVSIAEYNLNFIAKKIENDINITVRFNMIKCDYVQAIGLIFGNNVANLSVKY